MEVWGPENVIKIHKFPFAFWCGRKRAKRENIKAFIIFFVNATFV